MTDTPKTDEAAAATHDPQQDYISHLEHEVKMLTNAGVIECMVRNPAVSERIADLERRLADGEAELLRLRGWPHAHAAQL